MLDKLRGKSCEVYGDINCGKTNFVLSLIDDEDIVLFIDADRKIYDIKNKKENIFLYHCNDVEDIYNTLKEIIQYIDIVIIDSLPALKSKDYNMDSKYIDHDFYDMVKKIISLCKTSSCSVFTINQTRNGLEESTFAYKYLFQYYNLRIKIENKKPIITYNNLTKKLDLYNFF